jgi:hypothetical protein
VLINLKTLTLNIVGKKQNGRSQLRDLTRRMGQVWVKRQSRVGHKHESETANSVGAGGKAELAWPGDSVEYSGLSSRRCSEVGTRTNFRNVVLLTIHYLVDGLRPTEWLYILFYKYQFFVFHFSLPSSDWILTLHYIILFIPNSLNPPFPHRALTRQVSYDYFSLHCDYFIRSRI